MAASRPRIEIEPSMTGPTTLERQSGWWVLSICPTTGNTIARKWKRTRKAADHYASILRGQEQPEADRREAAR